MTTTINYIGQHHPETLDAGIALLFGLVATEALDPVWEAFGGFCEDRGDGMTRFSGNFADLSCAFSVDTDDAALIERWRAAVAQNQTREDYQARRADQAQRSAWFEGRARARLEAAQRAQRAWAAAHEVAQAGEVER